MTPEMGLTILRWGANFPPAEDAPPDDAAASIGEDALAEFLVAHRMDGRFLRRLRAEKPRWASRRLLFALWKTHQEALAHGKIQRSALRELSETLAPTDGPLLLLKGDSVYALLGDEARLYRSNDIDVLCPDPEALETAAVAFGSVSERISRFEPEFATLKRDAIAIEIHRYFPLCAYPVGMDGQDFDPKRHPHHWRQRVGNRVKTEITYGAAVTGITPGRTLEATPLMYPDVSLCLLILCANLFKDFLAPCYRYPLPVRFGSLCDIFDLAAHPAFDAEDLRRRIDQFGSPDAVRFAGGLLEAFFGQNPLAGMSGDDEALSLLRPLSFFGGWTSLYSTAAALLLPTGMDSLLTQVGAAPIALERGRSVAYSPVGKPQFIRLNLLITVGVPDDLMDFDILWQWGDGGLKCELRVNYRTTDDKEFFATLRGEHLEWSTWGSTDAISTAIPTAQGTRFKILFPSNLLSNHLLGKNPLALLLIITQFSRTASPYETAEPIIIAPFQFSFL